MQSDELMLKIENVSKIYRLGEIGGTTLRDELQRLKAKIFHKEDPTKKIGAKNYNKGEKFKALDNISFEVKKGERIGIIGHNGAGKSTLLKLISRVTGPTDGKIYLNGRVASMLEVGTGFHPELTGRENIYMNGAILGMTKKEIDAKMEDIIEFSEVRQFIDTPVKRYSSGMYVKLAFSVAAHLDSEIMIMDEVLAVGDMAFQNKCIKKMIDVSQNESRTILYVSHNMSTIKKLCSSVIVLDKGKVVFYGDVNKGISCYLKSTFETKSIIDLSSFERDKEIITGNIALTSAFIEETFLNIKTGCKFEFALRFNKLINVDKLWFRFIVLNSTLNPICTSHVLVRTNPNKLEITKKFSIDTSSLSPGTYHLNILCFEMDELGSQIRHDFVKNAIVLNVIDVGNFFEMQWQDDVWGNVKVDANEK